MDKIKELFEKKENPNILYEELKKNPYCITVTNLPVKIEKVLYDLTKTNIIGLLGIVIIRGKKYQCMWDIDGVCKRFRKFSVINGWSEQFDKLCKGVDAEDLSIVYCETFNI